MVRYYDRACPFQFKPVSCSHSERQLGGGLNSQVFFFFIVITKRIMMKKKSPMFIQLIID